MSAASLASVCTQVRATGATCDRVQYAELQTAITSRLTPPAVATPSSLLGDILQGTSIRVDPTGQELREANTGITTARAIVAETGSVVLTDHSAGGGLVSVFVEHHIVVAPASSVVDTVREGLAVVSECGGSGIIATGPSATADMGELVHGAHGPETVHVIVVEDR